MHQERTRSSWRNTGFNFASYSPCYLHFLKVYLSSPGLFLHVGYSIADRYLIEGNSNVKFDPVKTATKLGTLLNGDAAEQV